MLTYHIRNFQELSTNDLYAILKLRQEVFVVEQNCPYLDADDQDQSAIHMLGIDHNGDLHAYARLIEKGKSYTDFYSIGRVVISSSYRRQGEGQRLMIATLEKARNMGWFPIKISAQVYTIPFYQKLGFNTYGESYLEDGIPHIAMLYTIVSKK